MSNCTYGQRAPCDLPRNAPVWDPAFRTRFYARWGRENAVISATARRAEYADFEQLLSIKAVFGGVEEYFIDGCRVAVDEDTFLILNAGRRYGSRIHALRPVHSFSIFFRSGFAEEVLSVMRESTDTLLDSPPNGSTLKTEFDERLREHDGSITPALAVIKRSLECDGPDELRLDEQLHMLLARMLQAEHQLRKRSDVLLSAKPATRRELHRRLGGKNLHAHLYQGSHWTSGNGSCRAFIALSFPETLQNSVRNYTNRILESETNDGSPAIDSALRLDHDRNCGECWFWEPHVAISAFKSI